MPVMLPAPTSAYLRLPAPGASGIGGEIREAINALAEPQVRHSACLRLLFVLFPIKLFGEAF